MVIGTFTNDYYLGFKSHYVYMYHINIHCILHGSFRGAGKEWLEKNGRTPLLMATDYGRTEAVIKLLDNQADVEATDYNDRNVVHSIVNHGYVNMLKVKIVMIEAKDCMYVYICIF